MYSANQVGIESEASGTDEATRLETTARAPGHRVPSATRRSLMSDKQKAWGVGGDEQRGGDEQGKWGTRGKRADLGHVGAEVGNIARETKLDVDANIRPILGKTGANRGGRGGGGITEVALHGASTHHTRITHAAPHTHHTHITDAAPHTHHTRITHTSHTHHARITHASHTHHTRITHASHTRITHAAPHPHHK